MTYHKPFKTLEELLELLESRGLSISDPEKAKQWLLHLSYYRLSAWFLPFYTPQKQEEFPQGTDFEDIIRLYAFDKLFRLQIMSALEIIETSLRAVCAYKIAERFGSTGYLKPQNFKTQNDFENFEKRFEKERKRAKESFIDHYHQQYSGDWQFFPIWMAVEVMSFGTLSKLFEAIGDRAFRNEIAHIYGLDEKNLASILHSMAYVRNLCAHHARLWNRTLTISAKIPKRLKSQINGAGNSRKKIYETVIILNYLLQTISPTSHFLKNIEKLILTHDVEMCAMGFPENWKA